MKRLIHARYDFDVPSAARVRGRLLFLILSILVKSHCCCCSSWRLGVSARAPVLARSAQAPDGADDRPQRADDRKISKSHFLLFRAKRLKPVFFCALRGSVVHTLLLLMLVSQFCTSAPHILLFSSPRCLCASPGFSSTVSLIVNPPPPCAPVY